MSQQSGSGVRAMLRSPMVIAVVVVLAWFILTFLLLPNINLLLSVFFPDGQLSARSIERLIGSERAMRSLLNSFILAIALSVTVNVVGIFIVLVTRFFAIRGSRILWLGYATTLIYGGIVLVAGYKFIYGDDGYITKLLLRVFPSMDPEWFTGAFAVIFVMTFATTSNHMLFLTTALAKVDHQTVEAAQQMGASTWTILWRVVIPTLKPTLYAITILTFLGGLGALAAPQILGGRTFQTITPMILTFANSPTSRDLAATLALILGAATMILLLVMNRLERGGTYFSVSKVPAPLQRQKIHNRFANAAVHAVAYLLFLIYLVPPVLIVLFSFTSSSAIAAGTFSLSDLTIANYRQVLTESSALQPFLVSIGYAAFASIVVIVGILFVARIITRYRNRISSAIEYLLHIPWVLPSSMIALGLMMTFDRSQGLVGGKVLTGTLLILGIAYVIVKIPFTLRMMKAAFTGINQNLEEAASMLGAGQFYTFRKVLVPLVAPAAAAITALNFNGLLDDYDMAVFLANPFYQPLGIFIKNATEGETVANSTALTFVYTVVLMVITGATMWLVYGNGSKLFARRKK